MTPLIEIALEPVSQLDAEKLSAALASMTVSDPDFKVGYDHESGQTIIRGDDEPHLEAKLSSLLEEYGVNIEIGAPQVAYRETITRKVDIDYTYKKLNGGAGQFARIKVMVEPGPAGSGFVFKNAVVGGSIPDKFIPGVTKGFEAAKENGLLAGFPLIDFKITLTDGAYHDLDSSTLSFELAARGAFKDLREKGEPRLLEPIMKLDVATPEQYLGAVIADLKSRNANIETRMERGNVVVVGALVPFTTMFGYARSLNKQSHGRAQFIMTFDRYAAVPVMPPPDDVFPSAIGEHYLSCGT